MCVGISLYTFKIDHSPSRGLVLGSIWRIWSQTLLINTGCENPNWQEAGRSWLYTKQQSSVWQGGGLVPRTTRLQIRCPNHLATLPPQCLMENLWHEKEKPLLSLSLSLSLPLPHKKSSIAMNDLKILTKSQLLKLVILK